MKPLDRNISVLEHIVSYCQQIEQTVERFGNSAETFQNDPIYRNAAALCILQIGELVGKLTSSGRSTPPFLGGRSRPCGTLWHTATAPLTLKPLGRSSRMTFPH